MGRTADPVEGAEPGPGGREAVRRALAGGARPDQGAQLCTVRNRVSGGTAQGPIASGIPQQM